VCVLRLSHRTQDTRKTCLVTIHSLPLPDLPHCQSAALPICRTASSALQNLYSAAVELLGERDEQMDELRADLEDVKTMYREQIDHLLRQQAGQQAELLAD
jgi:hypothetical protein